VGQASAIQVLIAVDTNVLVRLITWDDQQQAEQAQTLVDAGPVFVSLVALLETEWVLRSSHGFDREDVASALLSLFALPNIIVEQSTLARWAVECHGRGADLGDALLLASAREAEEFATFDKRLPKKLSAGSPVTIRLIDR
jgi:predicted nucleic-acid-binding protein